MAVSKLWPVTVRLATVLDYASNPEKTTKSKSKYSDADYQALRDVVAYAKDGEKTERELFCEGIHCNPQTAREQFITVKSNSTSRMASKPITVISALRKPTSHRSLHSGSVWRSQKECGATGFKSL